MTWQLVALALGWILAAGAIYLAGIWRGQITRYDDCAYTRIGVQPVYVCPVGDAELPVHSIEPEQA